MMMMILIIIIIIINNLVVWMKLNACTSLHGVSGFGSW
jgi:hypothetical protein